MSGNGTDLGHVFAMLQQVIANQAGQEGRFDRIERELSEVKQGMHELKVDMRSVKRDVVDLRQTVRDYHGAVVGQGIAVSEH